MSASNKTLDASRSKDTPVAPVPMDDVATQAYGDMPQNGEFDGNINDEEMMTLEYDLEPVVTPAVQSKPDSQASDAIPTQVVNEVELYEGDGGRKHGSAETASQSSSFAPTQVFDLSDQIRLESQIDVAVTQTFDAANSRRSNSQTDFLATQVFNAVSATHGNSVGSPCLNSRPGNSHTEPATQVFDALPTVQQKSDGSPGLTSCRSNSEADLLPTQVFCEPMAVATATQRRFGSSPQQSTQTFSAPHLPQRMSGASKDGSRMSFSPESCSTQVFPSETNFPHLTLEMSECNDSHNDSCTVTSAAARVSLQQVSSSDLHSTLCLHKNVPLYFYDNFGKY